MKKSILLISGLLFLGACNQSASSKINPENLKQAEQSALSMGKIPAITFEKTEYNFGTIKQGTAVETIFKFKNTGEAPLVITNASSSCGCTVPEKPEAPIKPGETGEIKVHFNGSGIDLVTKTITILANTQEGSHTLTIKATVVK